MLGQSSYARLSSKVDASVAVAFQLGIRVHLSQRPHAEPSAVSAATRSAISLIWSSLTAFPSSRAESYERCGGADARRSERGKSASLRFPSPSGTPYGKRQRPKPEGGENAPRSEQSKPAPLRRCAEDVPDAAGPSV